MSLGRRIERRPRTRLRARPSRPERRAEPRRSLRFAQGRRFHPSLRPLGTRTFRRNRPPPAGRICPPTPAPGGCAAGYLRLGQEPRPSAEPPTGGWGCRPSAGAAGGHSLLRPRVPDGRAAPGCRWLRPSVSCEGGEQRGAPARIALSGRGRRSMRARARGRPGPHPATRGTGMQETSAQWKRSQSDRPEPAGQSERPRAVQRRSQPAGGATPWRPRWRRTPPSPASGCRWGSP